jgi:predicted PolB exonuclease-like 3'-5' exonuclease
MRQHPAFLIMDIETVTDGRLLQKIRYPEKPELTPQEAIKIHRAELMEKNGTDFIPHTFQLPVSVAVAKVASDHSLLGLATLDRPRLRPQVITRQFWRGYEQYGNPTLVTFNGRGFDLPVLEMASFRYGIPLPGWFKTNAKQWEDPRNRYNSTAHLDLQDVFTNFGAARQSGGLNLLAQLMGKPGKMDTKGAMVQDLYDAGEHLRIDDYCQCDCLDTYFVFLRLRVLQGLLSLEDERRRVESAYDLIVTLAKEQPALQEYLKQFRFWQPYGEDDSPFLSDRAIEPKHISALDPS